jgi:hypothetical protein
VRASKSLVASSASPKMYKHHAESGGLNRVSLLQRDNPSVSTQSESNSENGFDWLEAISVGLVVQIPISMYLILIRVVFYVSCSAS